ncbi:MAG: hypothetical protein AAFQ16_11315 [Pseudomonadota bacterium]
MKIASELDSGTLFTDDCGHYLFRGVFHSEGRLEVIVGFSESERQIRVALDHALAYRVINESFRLSASGESLPDLLTLLDESDFLRWFHQESLGIYEDVSHYQILAGDVYVDVIASAAPQVMALDQTEQRGAADGR